MKAYVLYIDNEKSIRYKNDCVASATVDPGIDIVEVEGYNGVDALKLSDELGIKIIPYYLEQLKQGSREINNAFCCTAGHAKIWQMIVDSGKPGIVLEHDAIFQGQIESYLINDYQDIVWLGYRIQSFDDYKAPDREHVLIETDRFEGTHAYGITPKTAQKLLDNLYEHGFNDSLDGQLGMRNIFGLNMKIMDPPPIVAVVDGRDSCIESTGNPAQFNSLYTEGFLAGVRNPEKLFNVRHVFLNKNKNFLKAYEKVSEKVKPLSNRKIRALILGLDEGTEAYSLSNDALHHPESQAIILIPPYKIDLGQGNVVDSNNLVHYNLYFSWYYYKHQYYVIPDENTVQLGADGQKFDLIFFDCTRMSSDKLAYIETWVQDNLSDSGLGMLYHQNLGFTKLWQRP